MDNIRIKYADLWNHNDNIDYDIVDGDWDHKQCFLCRIDLLPDSYGFKWKCIYLVDKQWMVFKDWKYGDGGYLFGLDFERICFDCA